MLKVPQPLDFGPSLRVINCALRCLCILCSVTSWGGLGCTVTSVRASVQVLADEAQQQAELQEAELQLDGGCKRNDSDSNAALGSGEHDPDDAPCVSGARASSLQSRVQTHGRAAAALAAASPTRIAAAPETEEDHDLHAGIACDPFPRGLSVSEGMSSESEDGMGEELRSIV